MNPDAFYVDFGKLVRAHRQRLGLTQDQLGERVGLSRTSITNIEQGRQKILLHQLFRLAESLEISPDLLLPTKLAGESDRHIDQKLPKHLTDREKDWVRGIVVSPRKKGGASHGNSED